MKNLVARIPRKLLFVISGITLLGGGSGAAAVYVGADRLLGPSYADLNGPKCTTVATMRIKKADRYWIRKYVTTEGKGDGLSRLKTALRVAQTVQRAEKSDLVQVTVLDAAGPTERARMRGRAIGAQVVYIPDLDKVPEGAAVQPINAYYVDGAADQSGQFWGLRIDLPQEDAEAISAALTDDANCLDPIVEGQNALAAPAGHGATTVHGEPTGHGAETSPDGHDDEAATAEDDGFVAKITGKVNSMLFGETADEVPAGTEPLKPADEALPEHSQTKAASHPAEAEEHTAVVEIPDEKPAVKKAKASPAPVAAEDDDPEKHRRKPSEHAAAH